MNTPHHQSADEKFTFFETDKFILRMLQVNGLPQWVRCRVPQSASQRSEILGGVGEGKNCGKACLSLSPFSSVLLIGTETSRFCRSDWSVACRSPRSFRKVRQAQHIKEQEAELLDDLRVLEHQ
jgi:hypothetical protein